MMIKVFTTDRNGKITLSEKELKDLLDEAYWEGYRSNSHTWTYKSPSWTPFYYTTTGNTSTITLSNNAAETASSTTASSSINLGNTYSISTEDTSKGIKSGCYNVQDNR